MSFLNSDPSMTRRRKKSIFKYSEMKISDFLRDFCSFTSLHGFNFLYHSESIPSRIAWIFSIVAMLGVGAFFLMINTNTYLKSKLATNIESSTADLNVSRSQLCNEVLYDPLPQGVSKNMISQT